MRFAFSAHKSGAERTYVAINSATENNGDSFCKWHETSQPSLSLSPPYSTATGATRKSSISRRKQPPIRIAAHIFHGCRDA